MPPSLLQPAPSGDAGLTGGLLTLTEAEQFLYLEARLLDERRFEAWRDLFAEDGLYWAPTRHDQASPDEAVSLFLDDRTTMAARIRRLRHPDVHAQVPISHTAHIVSNVELGPQGDGDSQVFAAFMMGEYRHTEPRWYAGRYEYQLRRVAGALRIALKKVVLVNCTAPLTSMAVYL
jgi:3-phenylpropionate/cinnamic acid dioxygenase small subunit